MSEAPPNPPDPRPRVNKEYEDPHYHDEEQDIQPDEHGRAGRPLVKKKPARKVPPPRRYHPDD
jgi:hypothetical protein